MFRIDSGLSGLYVSDLYPQRGQKVLIRAFVSPEVDLVSSRIKIVRHENVDTQQLEKDGAFLKAVVDIDEETIRWWFEFRIRNTDTPDEIIYFTKAGEQTEIPVYNQCFELFSDLRIADWVAESTCYQIMPDRFCNGNPEIGVKDGDYSYDGVSCRQMKWNEAPLPFDRGKCLDFYNGDFAGIEKQIPYLKKLGITCLYLNPIACSMTTHRYDCTDYFHIDPKLGGDEAYAHLITVLHQNGIRVVTDISINHTGTMNKWFLSAQAGGPEESYYFKNSDGSFACWNDVPTLPQLNYSNPALREIVYKSPDSVMRKFLKAPFNQDGWRLDVADVVGNSPKATLCKEVWSEVNSSLKAEKSDTYLVAEDWQDPSGFFNGHMWDASMNYLGCSRPLRRWAGEMDRFQLTGWGQNPEKARPYTGEELKQALELQLSSIPGQYAFIQFNLIDSHDTARFHHFSEIFNLDIYLGMLCFMYMLPGMPSTYYGDEILLEGSTGSIENARYPMDWDPARQSCRTFLTLTTLGQMRKDHRQTLSFGQYKFLSAQKESLVFSRYTEKEALILILNRGDASDFALDFFAPNKVYTDIFSGQTLIYNVSLAPKQSTILHVSNPFT